MCDTPSDFKTLYDLDLSIVEKINIIAEKMYGAKGVTFSVDARNQIKQIENLGYRNYPICIAKTPASLTDNPKMSGCPKDFEINVAGARVHAGAGFIVIYTGKIMTMPGLPKQPTALNIDVDESGNISGLF